MVLCEKLAAEQDLTMIDRYLATISSCQDLITETLHRKFVAAKMARKRAEEDLKLLCNRIGLLKSEENKVNPQLLNFLKGSKKN